MKKVTILVLLMISATCVSELNAQCAQYTNYATCQAWNGSYNSYFYITPNIPLSISSEIRTSELGGWGGIEVNWSGGAAMYLHYYNGPMFPYQTDYSYETVPASENNGQIEIWAASGTSSYARAIVSW